MIPILSFCSTRKRYSIHQDAHKGHPGEYYPRFTFLTALEMMLLE